uniref:3'-5' exonuclease domain-containing protein n=1 Tax=Glossina pallidipes TaxID=7398 RepID=A0A1A9ZM49_GLOPL
MYWQGWRNGEKRLIGEQIEFAANNALAAVEIFKNLIQKLQAKTSMRFTKADFSEMKPKIGHYFGLHFRKDLVTCLSRSYEAPFEGCFLEAPEDGETLCSVNEQKANWYLQEQLGVKIKSVPFTIRLNFKPPLGFYHIEKNECVVCGHSDAFVHKNLVPMEYRVHFPIVTQLHTSNDILTLCPKCDRLNSANDLIIQQELSEICDAPYSYEQLKKVKMTARQLIHNASEMSMERRKSLEALVLAYFKAQKNLTLHMLIEASELNLRVQDCYEHDWKYEPRIVEIY